MRLDWVLHESNNDGVDGSVENWRWMSPQTPPRPRGLLSFRGASTGCLPLPASMRPSGNSATAPPVIIEWRSDRGFGVSTQEVDDYGSGPDELYPNAKAAFDRVVRLVLSGGRTEPPRAVRLAELRQYRGISQAELAERAGVGQANISRIEGRDDLKISTLVKVVEAMGGSLSIRARFPDGVEKELEV